MENFQSGKKGGLAAMRRLTLDRENTTVFVGHFSLFVLLLFAFNLSVLDPRRRRGAWIE